MEMQLDLFNVVSSSHLPSFTHCCDVCMMCYTASYVSPAWSLLRFPVGVVCSQMAFNGYVKGLSCVRCVNRLLCGLQAFANRVMKAEQASKEPFKSSIENFYQTDSITRNSSVMAKCVQARKNMHIDTLSSSAEMSTQ